MTSAFNQTNTQLKYFCFGLVNLFVEERCRLSPVDVVSLCRYFFLAPIYVSLKSLTQRLYLEMIYKSLSSVSCCSTILRIASSRHMISRVRAILMQVKRLGLAQVTLSYWSTYLQHFVWENVLYGGIKQERNSRH